MDLWIDGYLPADDGGGAAFGTVALRGDPSPTYAGRANIVAAAHFWSPPCVRPPNRETRILLESRVLQERLRWLSARSPHDIKVLFQSREFSSGSFGRPPPPTHGPLSLVGCPHTSRQHPLQRMNQFVQLFLVLQLQRGVVRFLFTVRPRFCKKIRRTAIRVRLPPLSRTNGTNCSQMQRRGVVGQPSSAPSARGRVG